MGEEYNSKMPVEYACPVCGQKFSDVHSLAKHLDQHSKKEAELERAREQQKLAAQKALDKDKLEKLKKLYEDSANNYLNAKKKYEEDYGKIFDDDSLGDIMNSLHELLDQSRGWRFL